MEINSASNAGSQPLLDLPPKTRVPARQLASQETGSPGQGVQDQVSLSPAALRAASAATASSKESDADYDGNDTSATQDADATGASQDPSAVKSFVYGTLGLEKPAAEPQPEQTSDQYYKAGRWLAAAATVGTLVSLLA